MKQTEDMKNLLAPLGVYRLEGLYNGTELTAVGAALEQVEDRLDEILREVFPVTAEDWGLEKWAGLFAARPAASSPRALGEAIAALLRMGGDSFTPEAINDAIRGCGLPVRVEEQGPGVVRVSFPGIPGIPENFDLLNRFVTDILPAQVQVNYNFWYLTWVGLEEKFPSWGSLERAGLTWRELEEYM